MWAVHGDFLLKSIVWKSGEVKIEVHKEKPGKCYLN